VPRWIIKFYDAPCCLMKSRLRRRSAQPTPPSEPPAVTAQASDVEVLAAQQSLELNVNSNAEPQKTDPLVLELAGNGFSTSGLSRSVRFVPGC
jgi:hypothetical protein